MPRNPQRNAADGISFDATFPARVDALPVQRHDFSGWLGGLGVVQDVVDDLTVVFSELTTNAVHGSPEHGSQVTVRAWRDDGDLVLDVRNATDADAERARRWNMDDPLREGGRGLLIVRALVDMLDVSRDGRDLAVRCRSRVFDGGGA